jgi:uncharacterized protein (DUF433 family)
MTANVQRAGHYRLFSTAESMRVIELDGEQFALLQGQKGDLLIAADTHHDAAELLQRGQYQLVEFTDDDRFQGLPRLFLEWRGEYYEAILPRGLPRETEDGDRRPYIQTNQRFAFEELSGVLGGAHGPRNAAPHDSPLPDYAQRSIDEIVAAMDDLDDEQVRAVREYEAATFRRSSILNVCDARLHDADTPGLAHYGELDDEQLIACLSELPRAELEKLLTYEARHQNRGAVLDAIHAQLALR